MPHTENFPLSTLVKWKQLINENACYYKIVDIDWILISSIKTKAESPHVCAYVYRRWKAPFIRKCNPHIWPLIHDNIVDQIYFLPWLLLQHQSENPFIRITKNASTCALIRAFEIFTLQQATHVSIHASGSIPGDKQNTAGTPTWWIERWNVLISVLCGYSRFFSANNIHNPYRLFGKARVDMLVQILSTSCANITVPPIGGNPPAFSFNRLAMMIR